MAISLQVDQLSKRYLLPPNNGSSVARELWSLRDVSFSVEEGEIFGIIGRNGAGKSTLLKILSRITEPTSGRARIRGKVASLLEVGTGFHPELSGRENIFLNGAFLGMARAETAQRFDEIVAFSGLAKFIDTPVKRYSSGMYVRLAFSVAAHLNADVLLVDEVLAVGDYEFQQRCLDKTRALAGSGRSVLFVSHNLALISRLCHRVMLIDSGTARFAGAPMDAVDQYVALAQSQLAQVEATERPELPAQVLKLYLADHQSVNRSHVGYHEPFDIVVEYVLRQNLSNCLIGFNLGSADGTAIFATSDADADPLRRGMRLAGHYTARVTIPGRWLNTGRYLVQAHITEEISQSVLHQSNALAFNVVETDTPSQTTMVRKRLGVLQPILNWELTCHTPH